MSDKSFTYTEQYKFECLARYVANMPDNERRQFLRNIRDKHGEDYHKKLLYESRRQYKLLRAKK